MTTLEPGEPFEIEYGRGHRLTVVALNHRQRRRCIQLMQSVSSATDPQSVLSVLDELESVVRVCSPDITDERFDSLDDQLMVEIVSKTLSRTRVDEDEQKKSESPH